MSDEVPEALRSHVAQLRGERANAVAYGQTDIVAAVDRQLDALGIAAPSVQPEDTEETPDPAAANGPQGRMDAARTQAPKGRSASGPKQNTSGTV